MTELRFESQWFRASDVGPQSSLPSMRFGGGGFVKTDLDEDDGLFFNYGVVRNVLPYQQQDGYTRKLENREVAVAVLENEYLRAVFVPSLGGKLWSLYDKEHGRELLNVNPVMRPCNLALRNAWMSGGIEWNIGMTGHSPFTCSPLFVARTEDEDGTPVLRMYEFERRNGSVYQMDFFLPAGSRYLFARMRIVNPHPTVIPMYWWSTVAVDELPGARVVVPATDTYITGGGYDRVVKRPVPVTEKVDVTYAVHNRNSIDFFFNVRAPRKYMTQIDAEGFGLLQTSTARQTGRKLFVWGQGAGGKRWQQFLTDGGRPYVEIQAGLAHTQLESLPMPGHNAWEWIEAYGAIQTDPARIHGAWDTARATVEAHLDQTLPAEELEALLRRTRRSFATKPAALLSAGSGWGALEQLRRKAQGERPLPEHLDFGAPGEAQRMWVELLERGALPEIDPMTPPPSYMIQPEWMRLLERQPEGYLQQLMLGLADFAEGRDEAAERHFTRSLALGYSPWGLYAMACVRSAQGQRALAADLARAAAALRPHDFSLVKEALSMLAAAEKWQQTLDFAATLPADVAERGSVQLSIARALARLGRLEEAETVFYRDGGIVVPDLREGENSITELWFYLEEQKALREGRSFDEKTAVPPAFANFRMQVEQD